MPNRELLIDKLGALPPDKRDELTRIIKQSLQGMFSSPTMPQVQGGGTSDQIPTVPKKSLRPKLIVSDNGDIDEEELIKLLAALPT